LIHRVIQVARTGIGASAALPATDTLHRVDERGYIVETPERSNYWHAQTPQAFPRALIQAAHRRALQEQVAATDDAALVVHFGGIVQVVRGERDNLKITEPVDAELATFLLSRRP
jgi:2-C-methyl-D-erythritol 4-phosphate cytidylyltransferase